MTSDFYDLNKGPDLLGLLRAFQQETMSKLNCMRIGLIDEILPNNEVRCSITNKKLVSTNADGSNVWQQYPPIFAKVYYMGSANNNTSYPLTINTPCLLLFNDREFNSFFSTGEVSTLSDVRMHSLSDCICIPLFIPTTLTSFAINGGTIDITAEENVNIKGKVVNINAETVNINGKLIINGQEYLQHKHTNGNQGANTGGVVV